MHSIFLLINPNPKGCQEKSLAVPFRVQGKNSQIFQMCQSRIKMNSIVLPEISNKNNLWPYFKLTHPMTP